MSTVGGFEEMERETRDAWLRQGGRSGKRHVVAAGRALAPFLHFVETTTELRHPLEASTSPELFLLGD